MFKRRMALLLMGSILLFSLSACGKKEILSKEGTANDLMSSFDGYSESDQKSELANEFFEDMKYSVVEVNESEKEITLDMEVPNVSAVLADMLPSLNLENTNEEILSESEDLLLQKLKDEEYETETVQIVLPFEEKGDKTVIIPDENWDSFIGDMYQKMFFEILSSVSEVTE